VCTGHDGRGPGKPRNRLSETGRTGPKNQQAGYHDRAELIQGYIQSAKFSNSQVCPKAHFGDLNR